jgi:hypothetical protein
VTPKQPPKQSRPGAVKVDPKTGAKVEPATKAEPWKGKPSKGKF